MDEYKADKIAAITDEVGQFHPLLDVLLRKLPRSLNVEHTHGNTEMGADFVIARQDDTFGETEYVGVIAKVGKIGQDYTDIERQIEECELPRYFFGGKTEVTISEIWIITTGGITSQAQKKIQHKYASKKVKFISGARLIGLIDKYAPNFWTDIPLLIGEYLNRLWSRNDELDRQLSMLQVKEKGLYIEQDIYPVLPKEYRKKSRVIRPITVSEMVEKNRVILVEGSMGAGKSKLLRNLVHQYAFPQTYVRKKLLPITVSYRDFTTKYGGDVERLVADNIDAESLRQLPEDNEFLVLIDGVDEKDLPLKDLLTELSKVFDSVAGNDKVRFVVTSRYLGELDKNEKLLHGATRFELRPLSMNRLISFIGEICTNFKKDSRVIEDLKKSALFRELPRSPIAAILLGRLMNESSEELPSNMTELYSKYTELLLGRWDMSKGLQSQKEYDALDNILTRIAAYMIEHQIPVISLDEAKEIAREYLGPRNLGVKGTDLFEKMIRRCEIVAVDEAKNTLYFKHRTFAEYFYARRLLKMPPVVDSRVFQIYWMNIFFFFVGLHKDCPELLSQILSIEPENDGQRWMKVINMPLYFLAGYSSTYDVIEKGVAKMILESARLYDDVISKPQNGILGGFSRMQLLCMLQAVVRKSYSYQFFKPALENAALEIAEKESSRNVASAALFFLSVTNIELDGENKNSFDFLLENYLDELPLEIQLAIKHEEPDPKERSDLLRKLDKRHSRMMSLQVEGKLNLKAEFYQAKKAALQKKIDDLYERPIKLYKIT